MEMFKNAVNWAEIPVTDFERAKKFYSEIYDYQMPEMMMGDYRMGFLLSDQKEGIGAAIVYGTGYTPGKDGIKLYLNGGNNLETVLNRVEKAGGKIIVPKTQITPDLGYFAFFEDSEGNNMALHSMN